MKIVSIDQQQFSEGVAALQDTYRVFAPKAEGAFHNFRELSAGESPDFDFNNTRLSAKALVHPQTRAMFTYTTDETAEDHHRMKEVREADTPRAVIGIRPCDADAFLLVRRNFDSPEYKDPYWLSAYENMTFVGLACLKPCKACFCTTAGSGPFSTKGLDALLIETDNGYVAQVLTEKGESLVKTAGWSEASDPDGILETIETLGSEAEAKISSAVKTDRLRSKNTLELYEAPFWEDVAFSCINCGTCTYLCPTCWCFDIQDETAGRSGVRMRNWDSCMFPLFTLHGSGHNPRDQKTQRVRQRFMHKLKYYVDKYDNGIQCVGCGRCVTCCPVNIDIRRVCDLMNGYGESDDACESS